MDEYRIGQIILSKAGRDKAKIFVIVRVDGEYVYLVDGKLRKVDNPKKKKSKHIQPTNYIDEMLYNKIMNDQKINDSDVKKAIKLFENEKR